MSSERIEDLLNRLKTRADDLPPEARGSLFIEGTAHALIECMALMEGWHSYRSSFTEWVLLKSGASVAINTLIVNIDDVLLTAASRTFRMEMDGALKAFNKDWPWLYLHRMHDKIADRVVEMMHESVNPHRPIEKKSILGFIEMCNVSKRALNAGISDWLEVYKENINEG